MNIYEAKSIFIEVVNSFDNMKDFNWVDDFIYSDGDIEYQLRDYTNQDFCSILVRYCGDTTHCYREFYYDSNCDIYDLFCKALLEEIAEELWN